MRCINRCAVVMVEFRLGRAKTIGTFPNPRSATHPMTRFLVSMIAAFAALIPTVFAQNLPTSWVDKDTGHRIIRLSDEPGSSGFYFNVNAFTPDGKSMVYNAPDGIRVLDLSTLNTRLLVPNPPRAAGAVPGTPGFFREWRMPSSSAERPTRSSTEDGPSYQPEHDLQGECRHWRSYDARDLASTCECGHHQRRRDTRSGHI